MTVEEMCQCTSSSSRRRLSARRTTVLIPQVKRRNFAKVEGYPRWNEHGNDFVVYNAVEPDSLIAILWQ